MADNKIMLSSGEVLIDLSGDTVEAGKVLDGLTFHGRSGDPLTGTMSDNGDVTGVIDTKAGQYTIPQGYHDGGGKVGIDAAEQTKLIAENIKNGVTILGVPGTYSGEPVCLQEKSAFPSFTPQTLTPDTGYDYFSQVDIAAINVTYTPNPSGGNTVTIG